MSAQLTDSARTDELAGLQPLLDAVAAVADLDAEERAASSGSCGG